MLETIIRRQWYLKKHLDTPLLKERENSLAFMAEKRNYSHHYLLSLAALRSFMKYTGGDTYPTELTVEQVEPYLYYPAGKVTSGWFIRHTALKGMFQWTVSRGIMTGGASFHGLA